MDDEELDEVVSEFITESHENLDQLDQELVELEQHPDPDVIARIFRTIHTIKGTSGFLGFSTLESITHVGENLLSKLRDGDLTVDRDITSALLAMVDAVREVLGVIEATGAEGTTAYDALVEELQRLDRGEPAANVRHLHALDTEPVDDPADAVDPDAPIGEHLIRAGLISEGELDEALVRQRDGDPRRVGELLVEQEAITSNDVVEVLKVQNEERLQVADSIRVDVGVLDDLMNLVGELVLARNQILQFTQDRHDPTFTATSQRLNLITTELQEGVMKTRMQPIENVWSKFPRVVRDLTVACGKQARLEMEGKHTELDKTLLEAIKDPLTHLVRNAVDHGLETPSARVAKGKPAEGVVRLRAYHEGGQVIIEIADDGAGIDPAVIRRKAVQKGLLTAEEAAARADRDIVNVIFTAGFSTADQVSNISGRGVGMDVVKTNIETIGGSVDVQTVLGEGTTFKVKIPLTLAIIPALLVTSGGDRYAIPQVSLLELVRLDGTHRETSIERIQGVPFHRLRGRLLPLVFLDQVFGSDTHADTDAVNIVVVQADDHQFGLVVDEISDTAEIVVKPLGRLLKNVNTFAGATIMGDGRVALILDVLGIADHIGIAGQRGAAGRAAATADDVAADLADRRRLLLFGLGARRLGLPLEAVARLEEFSDDDVEITGHRPVVQYRGQILHLVHLSEQLGIETSRLPDQTMKVVVYTEGDVSVGLVVDEIFDVVDEAIEVASRAASHGIAGTSVIHGAVTDVIDVREVLNRALPGLLETSATVVAA